MTKKDLLERLKNEPDNQQIFVHNGGQILNIDSVVTRFIIDPEPNEEMDEFAGKNSQDVRDMKGVIKVTLIVGVTSPYAKKI